MSWLPYREAAESAAREAGKLLAENAGRSHTVERKGVIDLVTEMDKASEALLVDRLRAAHPDAGLIAEEGSEIAGTGGRWIVDPLDGTTNYAHGHPQWCITIGFEKDGKVRAGVVFDPLRDEMFVASEGEGAFLNGRPIRVSKVATLNDSLLATGFPYDRRSRADYYMAYYKAAVVATQGVRRAGAAALDMAWVANGRLDAYFEQGIKPWDVAAGEILVREAGGTVSDYEGGPHVLTGRRTLATNGLVHAETVALLASVET
jgi:myo-inositol-1(or 4)-monophosphatase